MEGLALQTEKPKMSNEKKLEIVKMRIEGETLQSIADKFGVSRQHIDRAIRGILSDSGKYKKRKYKNITNWLQKNEMTSNELAKLLYITANSVSNKLNGKSDFTLWEVKKIIEITGMSFEEAFEETKPE